MSKLNIVILDTNVFLHDPNSIHNFPQALLIVPLVVIEELDSFKRGLDDIGKSARTVIRFLDKLAQKGKLTDGIDMENGGRIQVHILDKTSPKLPAGLDQKVKDNYLLRCALHFQEKIQKKGYKRSVTLITKDANLRIKAGALDVLTKDYNHIAIQKNENDFFGFQEIKETDENISQLYQDKKITKTENISHLTNNEYLQLKGNAATALGKWNEANKQIQLLQSPENAWGIQPRNREQKFAFDALFNPNIKLITLSGTAGTGKTLIAIACGLHQVTESLLYKKLLVARPIIPMGKELGYLPGEMQDKLRPWMQPIFDNLELLFTQSSNMDSTNKHTKENIKDNQKDSKNKFSPKEAIKDLMQMELLQVEPLTYIRGRSIPQQFLIVDEAQNLSPHEVKTIITRAGEGTKIVFTGDPDQIDHPYLSRYSNGLTYTMIKFQGQEIASHITLTKGERSALAELAAKIMD